MNRVDRLLALILLLQSRRVVTGAELAGHFELSVRTVYRDIAALAEAGVPVVAETGVGYSLLKGYHLPPVNFTAAEADALVAGGLLVGRFADPSLKAHMDSALAKVRAVLPRDRQDRAARLELAMGTTADVVPPHQADLALLQQALADRRVLRFVYRGAGKTRSATRTVEPLGLLRYLERWHLVAWCRTRRDIRDFRADRMERVTLLRETFPPRAGFSLSEHVRSMPRPELLARVRFTPLAADRARREWWLGIGDEKQAGHRVSDGVILTLATVDWARLASWLLSFGSEATVLGPDELREQLVKYARETLAHHDRKDS